MVRVVDAPNASSVPAVVHDASRKNRWQYESASGTRPGQCGRSEAGPVLRGRRIVVMRHIALDVLRAPFAIVRARSAAPALPARSHR
jgi:hypothetical protein